MSEPDAQDAQTQPVPPQAMIAVDATEKEILIQAMDNLIRRIGEDIAKLGVNAAQDGAFKLIAVRNLAIKIDQTKVKPAEKPSPSADRKPKK